ncbi:transcription factor E4F1 isoform X1 [Oncorhynchus mykiss]|uniref:transcription factor E4F1 isoform X1 n=1 Tax=Oncorhynchus mykiss TaxID=8022 RepID=UPI00187886F6|nr:transcription factor E4F1 isoform X1 [Oncorhynchus mykiss]
MNVENNNTAETVSEQTDHGNNIVTIQTTLGDEDEDVHKCGRCQSEFCTLEAFIQHKLQQNCTRAQEPQVPVNKPRDDNQEVFAPDGTSATLTRMDGSGLSSDEPDKSNNNVLSGEVEVEGHSSRSRRKRGGTGKATVQTEGTEAHSPDGADKPVYRVNKDGRYICQTCEKTFKTTNILRTHMITHSENKNFPCELCGSAFRTKGSLIRHNRRHTDERPYHCNLCGLSFRESGALTRHLKSITPCTEKIRFNQYKEILVSKDGQQKGVEAEAASLAAQQEVEQQEEEEAQAAVVSVVETDSGGQEVIHEVHFHMEVEGEGQEQQVILDQAQADALVAEGDNLICQAIINSGIALEAVTEEVEEAEEQALDGMPKEVLQVRDMEGRMTEIQVMEECVEMEAEEMVDISDKQEDLPPSKSHKCPHCSRSFKALNYLRFHVKGHLGCKPFKCVMCQKEFLTGYLLKKHMEVHLSERRYKCGECGKLYKTIGHVREHMRAHSEERPYNCNSCDKGYKTKNALQVHQRTHAQEKPYVCQFCSRGFREKGSLVRHIRHHTGEKPFKCHKCGRGFAEHGTLNRHLRAKGGCYAGQKEGSGEEGMLVSEEQVSADSLATAAIMSDDPHAVLVEFSSVVADTQEYIIRAPGVEEEEEEEGQGEEVTLIQDNQNQMGNHIMKVVQQIVNQSRGGIGGHQIIVRNVSMDEGTSISDCGDTITIATPENLTAQVAMTLASAISDGTLLAGGGALETPDGTVTMVTTSGGEDMVEVMEQQQEEEFVITSSEEVEIQTVII